MALREALISTPHSLAPQGAGPKGVLRKLAVGTTAQSFDLTAWKGRLIRINVTGAANYRFALLTGDALDVTTESVTASAPVAAGAGQITGASSVDRVVPNTTINGETVFLRIAAVTGTIDVCVEAS